MTLLFSAIINGSDWKIVELLLLADSDPNIADFSGNTPLHLCTAKRGSHDMVPGILLRFGANPNLKNENGNIFFRLAENIQLITNALHLKQLTIHENFNERPAK